jgi:hypothetical protein
MNIGNVKLLIRHIYREEDGVLNGHGISVVVTNCDEPGGGYDVKLRVIVHGDNPPLNNMDVVTSATVGLPQNFGLVTTLAVEASMRVNEVLGMR